MKKCCYILVYDISLFPIIDHMHSHIYAALLAQEKLFGKRYRLWLCLPASRIYYIDLWLGQHDPFAPIDVLPRPYDIVLVGFCMV